MNSSERFRPYRRAHRHLRSAFADALQRLACLNAEDTAVCGQLARDLHALLDLYAAHQHEEDSCLHAPLRECAPRALLAFDAEHEDQLAAIAALRPLLDQLQPGSAAPFISELELRLSQFIAEGLAHMADEETTLTRALWQHFTDEQLRGFAAGLHATASNEITAKEMT
jgi:hypothetical protein